MLLTDNCTSNKRVEFELQTIRSKEITCLIVMNNYLTASSDVKESKSLDPKK